MLSLIRKTSRQTMIAVGRKRMPCHQVSKLRISCHRSLPLPELTMSLWAASRPPRQDSRPWPLDSHQLTSLACHRLSPKTTATAVATIVLHRLTRPHHRTRVAARHQRTRRRRRATRPPPRATRRHRRATRRRLPATRRRRRATRRRLLATRLRRRAYASISNTIMLPLPPAAAAAAAAILY